MQPVQQRPVAKKSDRGCLIALASVGGGVFLLVAVGAFAVYRFSQSSTGKAVFGAIGDMTELVNESQNAPGTKEVRGLGCTQAMAMDVDKMTRIMQRFDAGGGPPAKFSKMVVCQVGVLGTPPTCDDVARTYLAAAGPPDRGFAVSVTKGTGKTTTVCSILYEPDGTMVGDLAPGATPTIPSSR
jgi:hypothetical protein